MTTSAPHVRTGRLRHRATLEVLEGTPDGAGGVEATWAPVRQVWCWIRPVSGSQRLESMRRASRVSHEIFFRYAPDISARNRIVYRGRVFNLEAVWTPDERREFLQAVAVEGDAT